MRSLSVALGSTIRKKVSEFVLGRRNPGHNTHFIVAAKCLLGMTFEVLPPLKCRG
jgi:hypothetical protein